MTKVPLRVLLPAAVLIAFLMMTACGGPVPESKDLVSGITVSPWPARSGVVLAYLTPEADAGQIEDLNNDVAAHKGVSAWQYDSNITLQDTRRMLNDGSDGIRLRGDEPPIPGAVVIVVAKDDSAHSDLIDWLSTRSEVGWVWYWSDGVLTTTKTSP